MIKLIYLTGFLFMVFFSTNGQTIKDLDAKHGYKEFKLGDDLSKWKSEMTFINADNDQLVHYIYNGNFGRKVFDIDVIAIELQFFQNKLVGIILTTKLFNPTFDQTGNYPGLGLDNYTSLVNQFAYLFGNGIFIPATTKTSADHKYVWNGNTTVLIVQYDYQGVKLGGRAFVNVYEKSYIDTKIKTGF